MYYLALHYQVVQYCVVQYQAVHYSLPEKTLTFIAPLAVEAMWAVAHTTGRFSRVDVNAFAAQTAVVVLRALVRELAARAPEHLAALTAAEDVEAMP